MLGLPPGARGLDEHVAPELDPRRLGRLDVGLHLRLGVVALVALCLSGVTNCGLEATLHQVVDDCLLVRCAEGARRAEAVEAVDEADRGQSGHEQLVAGRRGAGRLGGPGGCQVRPERLHLAGEASLVATEHFHLLTETTLVVLEPGVVSGELVDRLLCERTTQLVDLQLALKEVLDGIGEAHLTVSREHALGVADLVFPPPQSR